MLHRSDKASADRLKERIIMKTFGNFDLLVDKHPVAFKNAKAKELLAFLVCQYGSTASGAQIFFSLWDHLEYSATTSTYVRRTVRALKEELEGLGIGDVFIANRNCYSVDTSRFACDYYDLMSGSQDVAHLYNGEFMRQYSWGELTIPLIERKVASLNEGRF